MDQLIVISCNITAIPQPEINWTRDISGEVLLNSSRVSTHFDGKIAYSTLMYYFGNLDFIHNCTTVVSCRATNIYGTNERNFTLNFKNCTSISGLNSSDIQPSLSPDLYNTIENNEGQGNNSSATNKGATLYAVLAAISLVIPSATIIALLLIVLWCKR